MAQLDADLTPHLLRGERILWSGCPQTGWLLTRSDGGLIPAGILVFGIGLWSIFGAKNVEDDALRWLVTPMFLLGGLYLLVGRCAYDAWLRSRTIYAVTDQRVIRLQRAFRIRLRALDLGYIPQLRFDYRSGNIDFEPDPLIHPHTGAVLEVEPATATTPELRFDTLPDAEKVYRLIQQLDAARRAEILKSN